MPSEKHTIVLAWIVEDFKVVRERRTDLGERPELEQIFVPRAAIWLNKGSNDDARKAQAYAETVTDQKTVVFVYPTNTKDPLGHAKRDVMRMFPTGPL